MNFLLVAARVSGISTSHPHKSQNGETAVPSYLNMRGSKSKAEGHMFWVSGSRRYQALPFFPLYLY